MPLPAADRRDTADSMSDILDTILARKREEIAARARGSRCTS